MPKPSRGRSTGSGPNWTGSRTAPLRRTNAVTARSVGVDRLKPGQHPLFKPAHRGDRGFRIRVLEIDIDRADAEAAQCTQVGDDIRCAAGEQPPLPVGGLVGDRHAKAFNTIGQCDARRVASCLGSKPAQPRDAGLVAWQGVEQVPVVAADRIPGITQPRGATQRRAALAPTQIGGWGFCTGLGSKIIPSNLTQLPAACGISSVHSTRKARRYSSVTAPRAAKGDVTTASNSASSHPAPMPTISRPPDRMSIVASILAATTAGRCGTTMTASTRRMREVLAAM